MNEAFEKILEFIDEQIKIEESIAKSKNEGHPITHQYGANCMNVIKKFVHEVAEEYKGGWIPCSERLPEECVPVNVTWINRKPEPYYAKIKDVPFSATAVYYNGKWYWYSSTCVDYLSEYGKNDFDLIDKDIDIISWQPLPKPFKESDCEVSRTNLFKNETYIALKE